MKHAHNEVKFVIRTCPTKKWPPNFSSCFLDHAGEETSEPGQHVLKSTKNLSQKWKSSNWKMSSVSGGRMLGPPSSLVVFSRDRSCLSSWFWRNGGRRRQVKVKVNKATYPIWSASGRFLEASARVLEELARTFWNPSWLRKVYVSKFRQLSFLNINHAT